MNSILVLTHNEAHFRHYARDFFHDERVRFVNPQHVQQLEGLHPCAVIELPEWYIGKDRMFLEKVDMIKKRLQMKRACSV